MTTWMRLQNAPIRVHDELLADEGWLGQCPPDVPTGHEGVAVSEHGLPCQALTAKGEQCPKGAAVMLYLAGEARLTLCGGHHQVHLRRDMRIVR